MEIYNASQLVINTSSKLQVINFYENIILIISNIIFSLEKIKKRMEKEKRTPLCYSGMILSNVTTPFSLTSSRNKE